MRASLVTLAPCRHPSASHYSISCIASVYACTAAQCSMSRLGTCDISSTAVTPFVGEREKKSVAKEDIIKGTFFIFQ